MKNKNAQALGKMGGDVTIKKYPPEHFVAIGRKGWEKRKANQKLREQAKVKTTA